MNQLSPENFSGGLSFNSLAKSLCTSTGMGLISFDLSLKIADFTPNVSAYLELKDHIDQTLSGACDVHSWKNWTEIVRSVLTVGQTVHFEAVKVTTRGTTYVLNLVLAAVRHPQTQDIIGGGLVVTNVTEKVAFESELAQSERLNTMGRVAGRVAHELNNPLDGILRYVNLALRALDTQPDKARQYLQQCRDGLMRMVRIVSEMLEFSRGMHSPFEKEPLDKLLEEALATMAGVLDGVQVHLVRDYHGGALGVNSEAMFQVFCNLIKNAADAMGGKGTLTVRLTHTADGWEVAIRDTGGGFDPALSEDIFKPFFTTKQPGQGTGLGLAICRDILEKIGGSIMGRNIEGGSEFVVFLPEGD
jgi:signal transduction histidine kinase